MVLKFGTFSKPSKEHDLGDLIMQGLKGFEEVKRGGRLYVSDSGFCEKKSVLSSNYDGLIEYDGLKEYYTEAGITSEKVSLKGLDKSGSLLYADYRLPEIGLNLGGKVDGIVFWENRIYVLELKQIGTLPSSPEKTHESQAVFYSAVLGLPAILLYIDRKVSGMERDLLRKQFILDTSMTNRRKFTMITVKSELYNKYKLIPEKSIYLKKTHCKDAHCSFFDKCYGEDTDYSNWTKQGFKFTTPQQNQKIENEANLIVDNLLNPVIMKDRLTGVLKFLSEHGRENAKRLLLNKDWSSYYDSIR